VNHALVTLRGQPVRQSATLPDGRPVEIFVGVPDDPYIAKQEMDTVDVELRSGDAVLAAVNTVLRADQTSEALALAREIADGLTSGRLEATAGSIEPLADELRSPRA
jgi:hypothetical protein